jgi:hypothetical protein
VCQSCGEWNLAPIENRWEAIEECERAYEATIERGSTSQLSIGRSDDVVLFRVGGDEELPTLRYGARLKRRFVTHAARRGLRALVKAMYFLGVAGLGAIAGGFGGMLSGLIVGAVLYEVAAALANPLVASIPTPHGSSVDVTRRELHDARLVPDEPNGWHLRLRPGLELRGDDAFEAARLLLPLLTRSAEPLADLRKAVNYIAKKGGTADSVFEAAARRRGRRRTARISKLEVHIRLALEILAAREVEARALSDSLQHLRFAWKNADRLAAIQDELSYTPRLLTRFREIRDAARSSAVSRTRDSADAT